MERNDNISLICGDNLETLKQYPENYFDSVVTDPPYGLGKEPDALQMLGDWLERGRHEITGRGFMGKHWDNFVPQPEFWAEVYRVLKPGGHVATFGGTRTFDLISLGLRLAGFEYRDTIAWLYSSGFPKSLNVSLAIQKEQGADINKVQVKRNGGGDKKDVNRPLHIGNKDSGIGYKFTPETPEAQIWDGWGTALKPSFEPILIFRKPILENNIAANVLKWGTGGLNINATRLDSTGEITGCGGNSSNGYAGGLDSPEPGGRPVDGRFPPNSILDTEQAGKLDEQSGVTTSGTLKPKTDAPKTNKIFGKYKLANIHNYEGDQGGASRFFPVIDFDPEIDSPFFYESKASASERNAGARGVGKKKAGTLNMRTDEHSVRNGMDTKARPNFHPTVKPIRLMEWLIKLVTPPGGLILEPYLGSGTTAIAAKRLNFRCLGIEREADYYEIALARVAAVPESLFTEPDPPPKKEKVPDPQLGLL